MGNVSDLLLGRWKPLLVTIELTLWHYTWNNVKVGAF